MNIEQFGYQEGVLCCSGVPIPTILDSMAGLSSEGTPAYVYSERALANNCQQVKQAFLGDKVRYAVKACMNGSVLRRIHDQGFGFDVVSHGELNRAVMAGASGAEIVYAGAAKTDFEIYEAVKHGVTIVVECSEELEVIDEAASRLKKHIQLLLRLRPDVDVHTHHHLTTGKAFSKFGIPESVVRSILEGWKSEWAKISGIHFHIGSQIEGPEYTAQATGVALPLIDEFGLSVLDAGGGFPVCYDEEGSVPSVAEFAQAIKREIGDRLIELIIEPGRTLVADIAVLVTSVMSEEHGEDWRIVRCDAGMADLIRPMLYGAKHQIWPVLSGEMLSVPTFVAGPYCESTDFLARKINLPALGRRDLLAVMHVGAYGRAMASGYNGNLFAPEVLVTTSGQVVIMAHRESLGHSIETETGA